MSKRGTGRTTGRILQGVHLALRDKGAPIPIRDHFDNVTGRYPTRVQHEYCLRKVSEVLDVLGVAHSIDKSALTVTAHPLEKGD